MDDNTVYGNTTVPVDAGRLDKPLRRWGCIVVHLSCWRFWLKASQVGLSFFAFLFEELVQACTNCKGLYFFEFVSCTALILSISVLVVYCTSLYEKIGEQKVRQLELWIISVVWTFFIIASIVFAATSDKSALENIAIVFGFLASFAFCVDAVQMYKEKCTAREERQPEKTVNTLNATENQPLNNQV